MKPSTVFYNSNFFSLLRLVSQFPNTAFEESIQRDGMAQEHHIYLHQMKKCIKGYGNDWLCGAVTVHALTVRNHKKGMLAEFMMEGVYFYIDLYQFLSNAIEMLLLLNL